MPARTPFVPARGTPRRVRRGDPVAGTQSHRPWPLDSRFRGNERNPEARVHHSARRSSGLVASLAHPGGNITGFAVAEFSMYGKYLELLKEVAPHVIRVAVMMNPEQVPQAGNWRAIETVAPSFKVQLTAAHVRDSAEIE